MDAFTKPILLLPIRALHSITYKTHSSHRRVSHSNVGKNRRPYNVLLNIDMNLHICIHKLIRA